MIDRSVSTKQAYIAAILMFLALPLHAQKITGRFSTAVYGWEKFDTIGVSKNLLLGMQNFQVDVNHSGFTLSTSVYGNTLLSESLGDGAELRVRNLFAGYRNDERTFEARLGRVPVFAGVGVGAVDGGYFKFRAMEKKLTFAAYGGSNVPGSLVYDHNRDLKNNFLLGAQATGELAQGTRFGVSYVNRRIEREAYEALRPDSFFNPVTVTISPGSRATQLLGADISHNAAGRHDLYLYGRYDYDLNLERTRRAELGARTVVTGELTFLANFIYREPAIPYNSWFTIFPLSPVREYEGGLEYAFTPTLRASARYAYVGYDGDLSRRLSLGVATSYASLNYSGSIGYAGELSSFYLQGMYPLFDRMFTPTAAVSYSSYRLSAGSPDETMFSGALGAIIRPAAPVSFEAQMQMLNNKFMDNDVRGFLKVSYWFNHNLGAL
ncbi:MAG TPA: hypothetical protein VI932_09310 [Bacteroidota bacterium]|nr:hypothetical protein [Bacteroidota bacterium]